MLGGTSPRESTLVQRSAAAACTAETTPTSKPPANAQRKPCALAKVPINKRRTCVSVGELLNRLSRALCRQRAAQHLEPST
jgi:hypothetical protein